MTDKPQPSPEAKAMIRQWTEMQRQKYGEDWKEILAKEMADKAEPFVKSLLQLRDGAR